MHFSRSWPSILVERWLGGRSCQGRQPPKAGAAGPPLQGLPPTILGHEVDGCNMSSAGCVKTGRRAARRKSRWNGSAEVATCEPTLLQR